MRPSLTLCACVLLATSSAAAQVGQGEEAQPDEETQEEAAPSPAPAPPPTALPPVELEPPPVAPPSGRTWYGWQNLTADGAAVVFLVFAAGASGQGNDSLAWASLTTYALGGPIIHLAHGNPGTALGSVALRVGAPIGGAMLGCGAGGGDGEFGCLGGAALGFLAGYVTAVAVDAGALAYEEHEAPRGYSKARPLVVPTAGLTRHGGTLGLQAIF